jgi:iron complex transport system substrate-binding protein
LVASLRERIDALAKRTGPILPRKRLLVLEWTDPPMSGGHWTPGLVELAGGIPILSNPGANSQTLTWDAIASEDPDAIVVGPCGYDLEKTQQSIEELETNPTWRSLRAVQTDNVIAIDGNAYLNRPGPRLVETAEIIADAIAS